MAAPTNEHAKMASTPQEIRAAVTKFMTELGSDVEIVIGTLRIPAQNVSRIGDDALSEFGKVEVYPLY